MAGEIKVLTPEQQKFWELAGRESFLREKFYVTGGTPLAAFYLHHRLSEDIDLFSEEEIPVLPIRAFLGRVAGKLGITRTDYRQFLGLHTFQLFFPNQTILKIDFNYYPFPRIERGEKHLNLVVDSLLDIAVNKTHTIAMTPRARDFIDIYFAIKALKYDFRDLLSRARSKFDWHIDPVQMGSRLAAAAEVSDYPRMLRKISHQEWKQFFLSEARKLKKDIFKA